jgi:hypothetical protein
MGVVLAGVLAGVSQINNRSRDVDKLMAAVAKYTLAFPSMLVVLSRTLALRSMRKRP